MAEGVSGFVTQIVEVYRAFIETLPNWTQNFVNMFILVLVVFFYAWFIWKFYRFIAQKNILSLNLNKYSTGKHPFFTKMVAGGLNFIEYLIILPFLIFFWFSVFTIFLIFLTENLAVSSLLIISAVIIGAIRMTAYHNEELSKELAKLLPFILLGTSLINPNFFNIERIIGQLNQIPSFFSHILIYFLFIILLEAVLRFFVFIFSLFGLEEEPPQIKEEEKN